jgi:hypothetical protein
MHSVTGDVAAPGADHKSAPNSTFSTQLSGWIAPRRAPVRVRLAPLPGTAQIGGFVFSASQIPLTGRVVSNVVRYTKERGFHHRADLMRSLLLVLAGIVCLTVADIPGVLPGHALVRGLLIGIGLVPSILGELLVWRHWKSVENQLTQTRRRSLSSEQRATLQTRLVAGEPATVGVCSRLMDGESADFAAELAAVFKTAGWPAAPPIKTSLNDLAGYLSLFVTGENLERRAVFICSALNEVGIECRVEKHQRQLNRWHARARRHLLGCRP